MAMILIASSASADWESYISNGIDLGFGTYTNWREVNGETQTVIAYVDSNGQVWDYGIFDSSTGEQTGGQSFLEGDDFHDWHGDTFGLNSPINGSGCVMLTICNDRYNDVGNEWMEQ